MSKYAIWNKQDSVLTPSGQIFTADEWKERWPVAKLENVTVVGTSGLVNGGFFGILSEMKDMYEKQGADFSNASTDEEVLEVINNFLEEKRNTPPEPTAEERIAAAMEYQNLLSL